MRILMVTDFYPPFVGGVEVLVSSLSHELVRRGHEVAVATLATSDTPAHELDDGVRVHRIRTTTQRVSRLYATASRPWAPPVPDPSAVTSLRAIFARERPDVVHGHDWLARSYLPLKGRRPAAFVMSLHYFTLSCPKKSLMFDGAPCTGPAIGKCLRCAGQHYGTLKGTAVTLGHRAFGPVEARRVDLHLPVSEATAVGNQLTARGLPYTVVPNLVRPAPDPGPFAQQLSALPDQPFLLFVGDVRRDKGIDILLEAYAAMSAPPPLVLIGKVWPDTPSSLPAGVRLLRDWPNGAVREAMRSCLALVMPSRWPEPFGIVAAEAMTAGRPVVASRIGGIPEIVRDGQEGLLVEPGDPVGLAAALRRIVADDDLRERLAAQALQRAQIYTPAAVVPLIEEVYERVTSHQGG